jgi:o-succinylbenzoate synthase
MNCICSVNLWKGQPILSRPYPISFDTITSLDSLLIEITDDKKRWGIGEATFLTGYSGENIKQGQVVARNIASKILGRSNAEAQNIIEKDGKKFPSVQSLFNSAIYTLRKPLESPLRFPMVAWVNTSSMTESLKGTEKALKQGYKTIKIKVGINPIGDEIACLKSILNIIDGKATVRVDANGGFDEKKAVMFSNDIAHGAIEWLEQPLPKNLWEETSRVISKSPVPILLDESIISLETIQMASDLGAVGVKFKLAKAGSPQRLGEWIQKAYKLGLKITVGNGVQTDVGCLTEAAVSSFNGYYGPGEMNGWKKLSNPLLADRIKEEGCEFVLTGGKVTKKDIGLPLSEWKIFFRRIL